MLSVAIASDSLFTTDKNCSAWPYRSHWLRAGYEPFCMDDVFLRELVTSHCKHAPQKLIQYSDIGRLLILYARGGWYVDSDVKPTPLSHMLRSYPGTTFGLESNFSLRNAKHLGMLPESLALWTIYGVKGDERLKDMACTMAHLSTEKKPGFEKLQRYIFRTSGPTAQKRLWTGRVLPIGVFGCGQAHSQSPRCSAPTCWGCHTFRGRWLK